MNTPTTISPLDAFLAAFPSPKVSVYDDELKYRFSSEAIGLVMEKDAQEIILRHGLPVTAVLEVWTCGGVVFEVCLSVKPVPEEHLIA